MMATLGDLRWNKSMLPTDKAPQSNRRSGEETGYFPTGNDTPGNHCTRTVLETASNQDLDAQVIT